ncbi:MAG: DNA polymerase III subunit epsilon [Dehalococcoidia bacterium]|nr:MAG: DNA polymerase III subunit epsilon [Dehalococcoidia bacterium]
MLTEVLPLRRPLAFLDLETTGIAVDRDRIVEIAMVIVHPDGHEDENVFRVNPGVPIPPGASRVHGIFDHDVAGRPSFAALARTVDILLTGCDLAGFNILQFDLPLLEAEFARAGVRFGRDGRAIVDVMTLFHRKETLERRDLSAAVRHYCGREHVGAHTALADVRATVEILRRQLTCYADVPRDVSELHAFCRGGKPEHFLDADGRLRRREGEIVLGFGKHFGVPLDRLAREEPDYLHWILSERFSASVKAAVREALERHGSSAKASQPPRWWPPDRRRGR